MFGVSAYETCELFDNPLAEHYYARTVLSANAEQVWCEDPTLLSEFFRCQSLVLLPAIAPRLLLRNNPAFRQPA